MKSQVRFGCRIFQAANEPFQQIIKRAQFCEKQGFDSVLIDDHLLYGTGPKAAPAEGAWKKEGGMEGSSLDGQFSFVY